LSYAVGLEASLAVFQDSWVKTLAAFGLLVAAMFLLLYIVITNLHWYVNPLPFIALALLIRALATNLPYGRFRARQVTRSGILRLL
jgi:Zn-dependent protease with chaperone function